MIWLILLGLITYFFIVQWVAGITRTPVWLLWLVAMMPVFVLTAWSVAFQGQPMPIQFVILLFLGCLALYLYLIQRGRTPSRSQNPELETPTIDTPQAPLVETTPEIPAEPQTLRPMNKAEEGRLQACFPWTVFYLRHIEYRPQTVICRGQLRTTPEVAYQTVRDNVESQFGDRFHLVFQEGANREPFFELVTNPAAVVSSELREVRNEGKPAAKSKRFDLAGALVIITLITTTWAGLQTAGRVPTFPAIMEDGLPFSVSLMIFFTARSIGNYLTARKHGILTTLPYFIPMPPFPFFPVGALGAFTQLRSPIPNRKALLDIALVGAFWGLCVCIPILAWGLTQSEVVLLPERVGLFQFQALNPRFSIVLAGLGKLALGKSLVAQSAIKLHPVAAAGWVGLIFTAFNLMPIGQLDGGRAIHAVFGRRTGARIGQLSRFLFLGFAIANPHLLLWAILLLVLPAIDEPALNDVTELDSVRDIVGLLALAILILLVMPVPRFLAIFLGI
jgi:hypothetical protein